MRYNESFVVLLILFLSNFQQYFKKLYPLKKKAQTIKN